MSEMFNHRLYENILYIVCGSTVFLGISATVGVLQTKPSNIKYKL
jgi:hypothetical protein